MSHRPLALVPPVGTSGRGQVRFLPPQVPAGSELESRRILQAVVLFSQGVIGPPAHPPLHPHTQTPLPSHIQS